MTDRPKLVLHIGTHKTGTTTLQVLLSRQRRQLAAQGFLYPNSERPPRPHDRKHSFLLPLVRSGGAPFRATLETLIGELQDANCHTLVMSAEGLSTKAHLPGPDSLELLAGAFDVTVVCFLRRPDYFAESFWNHRCKAGLETAAIQGFATRGKLHKHVGYPSMLAAWKPAGRVVARGFEAARRNGLVESFARASGVPVRPDPEDANVSPSMTCAAYLVMFRRLGIKVDWKDVEASLVDVPRRTALGSRLRRQVLAEQAEMIQQLRREWSIQFPDDMPDEPEEPLALPSAKEVRRLAERLATGSGAKVVETPGENGAR